MDKSKKYIIIFISGIIFTILIGTYILNKDLDKVHFINDHEKIIEEYYSTTL
ncbi:hypothetical protein [Marinitoga lauensis]|uniref:hypothetical protein n=1 Tax=Marinitoga lauensis TaxID=2201189 RepID=UPI00140476FD|nr:hypothetical protein [Marinitoga lauensis]